MVYLFTESISYLLNRVGVQLGENFSGRLSEFDVTIPMYRVLATLRQHDSQTLRELRDLVSIEMSTLSRLVSQMVKRGLVTRIRPEENARTVRIDLTPEGMKMTDVLIPIAASFENGVLAMLDVQQVDNLKLNLRTISQNISQL